MKDKLIIVTRIKRTIEYVNKSLDNYPHKFLELKQRIINDFFDLLELCYLANNDYKKDENKMKCMVKISMIDYYLKLSYKNDLISKKKYESIAKHLLEINKMITAWRKGSEEKEESIQEDN